MIQYNFKLNDSMLIILQICDNFYVISVQVFTKKNTWRIYQHSRSLATFLTAWPQKVTANLNLLVNIFGLKQKTNEILPASLEEIKFCLFKKTALCSFRLYPLQSVKKYYRNFKKVFLNPTLPPMQSCEPIT